MRICCLCLRDAKLSRYGCQPTLGQRYGFAQIGVVRFGYGARIAERYPVGREHGRRFAALRKPRKPGLGEGDERSQVVGFGKFDAGCREECLGGFFGGLLAVVSGRVAIGRIAGQQPLRRVEVALGLGKPSIDFGARASSMEHAALAQRLARQRGGHAARPFGFGAGLDDHVAGHAGSEQGAIGRLCPLVGRQIGIGDDHEQIEIAVRAGRASGVGAEQDDPLRVQSLHQALAGFFNGGGDVHGRGGKGPWH